MSSFRESTDRAPVIAAHAPAVRAVVAKGYGAGQSILLRRVVSVLGSKPGCKVRLKHADVSGVHCAIVNTGGDVYLRDLASRQGTFLNDLRASHERLEDGDVVRISPWELRISVVEPASHDSSDVTGLGLEPAPAAIVVENVKTGRISQLPREVNVLGRSQSCDVTIEDRSISRAHVLMFTYLSQVIAFDLMRENGLRVNGQRVTFSNVKTDDVLTLGAVELRVKVVQPSPQVASESGGEPAAAPKPDGTFSDRIDIRTAEQGRGSAAPPRP